MSNAGKKYKYIENVIREDWELDMESLIAAVILACGNPPPTKRRPFFEFKEWKHKVNTLLRDMAPETKRAMVEGYVNALIPYLARTYLGAGRIDNYFHEQTVFAIRAARKKVRDAD
jgi:hypothetical protein